jgi:hypothetical protein
MGRPVRNIPDLLASAVAAQFNEFKREIAANNSKVHADVTCTETEAGATLAVASANASDLATSITLANELKLVYETHLADAVAHKLADAAPALTAASDLATGITLANAIKADYEVHRASTTYHYTADATNTIAAVNASDQSSLNTLLNELKTDINAHIAAAFTTRSIKIIGP